MNQRFASNVTPVTGWKIINVDVPWAKDLLRVTLNVRSVQMNSANIAIKIIKIVHSVIMVSPHKMAHAFFVKLIIVRPVQTLLFVTDVPLASAKKMKLVSHAESNIVLNVGILQIHVRNA